MAPIVAVVVAVAEAVASVATEVAATVGSIAEGVGGAVGIGAAEAGAIGAETFGGLGALAEGVSAPLAAAETGLAGTLSAMGATTAEIGAMVPVAGAGGLFGMTLPQTAGVGSLALSAGESLYSMLSTPSIPKSDISTLNAQIAGNVALSNQARATAQDALNKYSTGVLSSAYQGMYQAQYDKQLAQVRQQLASRGFTEDSTQWQSAMQSFNQWDANLKGQLLQSQLSDAMKASGLADTAIQDYYQKWGLTQQQAGLTASQQQQAGKAMAGVGTGLAKLFPETKTTTPTTTPSGGIEAFMAPTESVMSPAAGGGGWGGGVGEELP